MGLIDWPSVLGRLTARHDLSVDEAADALGGILDGHASPAQVAGFIVALRMKGETVDEMTGLLRALMARAEPVVLPPGTDAIDTCGTGGDRRHTINVSTIAAFVGAGAGAKVCKHGNRAASSACGSADVLEALGVTIEVSPSDVARCVEEAGIGFCFAPRYHPGMRHAGPIRRELGVPTVFNFVAPLANPGRVRRQVVGVSDPAMANKVAGVLRANGAVRAMVVYGHDGLDELTTTTTSTALELVDGDVRETTVDPSVFGLPGASLASLRGADAASNADIARRVLAGDRGPHRDIVVLNAAAGLVVAGLADDLGAGVELAAATIDSGKAAVALDRLVRASAITAG